ncbi:MAG: OmpA family protein [Alphaproteobacteria bacterium]|nr:OmpA family protein [Alphaproteobacteria bacterium]
MPPAPPKIAEAPSAPTPIAKAPEAPKPPSVPAPPSIEAKQVTPVPPSVPEISRPTETASLPDAAAPSVMESGETLMQVVFADGATRIPDNKLTDLKALAGRMSKDEDIRLQLLAYAEGTDANASKARRLSLSRALAVRSYLIDQGVRSTRIDVRALGNKAGSGPAERVDVVMMKK